jgi:hypothetical protein
MQLFTQPGVSIAELVDGVKSVSLGMGEIDQLHHRIGLASELVHIHLRFEKKRLYRFVRFQKRAIRLSNNLIAEIIELAVGQPFFVVNGAVDRSDVAPEHFGQHPFAKTSSQTRHWIGRNEAVPLIDDRPAQRRKLV